MSKSRDRFVVLAEARTKRAIKDIRLIGNLSNKSNYTYSVEDITKIFRTLNSELKLSKKRFIDSSKSSTSVNFKL